MKKPITALAMASLITSAYATPGKLANTPLFLTTGVQPNIFFMVDDSGSMGWETLLSREAFTLHPDAHNFNRAYTRPLDFTPNTHEEIRMLCPGYNVLAYDPAKTYTPWAGEDIRNPGNPYPNSQLNSAKNNPNYNGRRNLSNDLFFLWQDNGDKKYQLGECPVPNFNYGQTFDNADCARLPGCVNVSSLSASEQQDYANWYTYYRSREFVAKRALSSVISKATTRIGIASINATSANVHNSNNTSLIFAPVDNADDISTPVNPSAAQHKKRVLKSLFRMRPARSTPLRRALNDVGRYYNNQQPNGWGATPIESIQNGGECQQNFTILMSDGEWGGSGDMTWAVGDADTDNTSPYDGPP